MEDDTELSSQLSQAQSSAGDQLVLDLEVVLRSPQGRRVLLNLLHQCGVYRNAFTVESRVTEMRLGEQNIGLWLIAQLERVGPTEYPRLLLEAARAKDLNEETVHVVDEE